MIYILSDIHGNLRRFQSILEQIQLKAEDTLYILGDVMDRHPHGIQILRQIMAMPNAKMILGNHEYMMLRALGHPYDNNIDTGTALAHWYRNGGQVTHEAFNLLSPEEQAETIAFLQSLPLSIDLTWNGQPCKLVHGGPVEAFDHDPKYFGPVHYAVWKRWKPEDSWPTGYTMIFGHTPTRYYRDIVPMEVWYQDNLIGIDCGSGYPEDPAQDHSKYGRLACLRLDDGKIFYSREDWKDV